MKKLIAMAFTSLILSSCIKERISGNGDVKTDTRNISGFTGVHSSGSNKIHIIYGAAFKVEVKGSSNLIPHFKTIVHANTLDVGYENGVNVKLNDIEVYVTMPVVNNVSLSGSGGADFSGNFPLIDSFNLTISGSANATALDAFPCNSIKVNISGSGNADLLKIASKQADVKISGSGNVQVSASQDLKVRISGSGDVYYSGNPAISSEVSGSGRVRKW